LKTKIITLESHDDLISVRDKLSWAKTPRILLVWPKYEKVTLRLLDLKVLQRHADSLGAQLGLVTRRMNVRRDAESLGIPVFKTTSAAQKDVWAESAPRTQRTPKPPRRDLRELRDGVYVKEPSWRTSLLGRVVAFTAGVMAVLVVAGLFVPRAAVTLHPEAQTVSVIIPVTADLATRSVSLNGEIPAQTITLVVSEEQTLPITSTISMPQSKAAGVVQFTNSSSEEIIIPEGTIVSTNTLIRFATLNAVRLPAGVDEVVEVKVEATEAGTDGNVDAGAITVVEGTLGLSATALNLEPTTGGTDANVIGSTEEDRAALRERVLTALDAKAKDQIRANIGINDLLISDTILMNELRREEFSPPAGVSGTTLTFLAEAEFTARYILAEDLNTLAVSSVMASIPAGFLAQSEMTFNPIAAPITDPSGVTRFQLQASQTALQEVDLMTVYDLIRGREKQLAIRTLREAFLFQTEPQIEITPSWWRWLPLIPFNISVEVQ
jgi:hypothetical protein